MITVAGSPTLRPRMRLAGLERAKEFTWRKAAERTLAVLDSILPREAPEQPEGPRPVS